MGTMVKMYIHVLLVDIHESLLFRKCESNFINKIIKCSNALLISDVIRPRTSTCNSEEQKQQVQVVYSKNRERKESQVNGI